MKVAFLLEGFSSNGGIGRVVSMLCNSFVDEGIETLAISFSCNGEKDLYKLNHSVKRECLLSQPVSMVDALVRYNIVQKIRKTVQNEEPDYLIACGALYFPLGVLGTMLSGVRLICWDHMSPTVKSDYRFQRSGRFIGLLGSKRYVTLTKDSVRLYHEMYKGVFDRKIVQIYNPIEIKQESLPYDVNSKKIISVGRLTYQKNYELLIEIASRILKANPSWSWDIYGEGERRDSLQNLINEKGLADRLKLKGQVDNILSLYSKYSFFVMTSRYEGFPMVLLEASAGGLPLLSFDIQTGPREIIQNGVNGFIVRPFDIDNMQKQIECLMHDPELRCFLSLGSRKLAHRFAIEQCISEWKRLFNAVV